MLSSHTRSWSVLSDEQDVEEDLREEITVAEEELDTCLYGTQREKKKMESRKASHDALA